MFRANNEALAKTLSLANFHFEKWKPGISRFSVWAIHIGWVATGTLVGLIFTIKFVGLLLTGGKYTDPFKRYTAILPGNPINVLSSYNCSITQQRVNEQIDSSRFMCVIFPQDDFFDIIHIEAQNNKITGITFYATNVSVGQLLLHWKPRIRPQIEGITIGWNTADYSIEVIKMDAARNSSEFNDNHLQYDMQLRIITIR